MAEPPAATVRLVNGVRFSGGGGQVPSLDLTDPMAVLALKLVAGGTDEIRKRAARRDERVRQLVKTAGGSSTSEAITLAALTDRLAANAKKQSEANKQLAAQRQTLSNVKSQVAAAEQTFEEMEASRRQFSAVLWWLGIGWLIWTLTGKAAAHAAAAAAYLSAKEAEEQATAAEQNTRQKLEGLVAEATLIAKIQALDAEPLPLLNSFGWSHVPFHVERLEPAFPGSVVFAHVWNPNFEHRLPDIPNGLERADELRERVDTLVSTPILLSPTVDSAPGLRGLTGEEMLLARQIDSLSALVGDAADREVHASMLPADAAVASQLNHWQTDVDLPADRIPFSHDRDFDVAATLVGLAKQVKTEIESPEKNLARRLEGLAETLRTRAQDYSDLRSNSIEAMLGRTLEEWRRWSMLPLLRRYCPSYHRVPKYRYHRLGLVASQEERRVNQHPASLILSNDHRRTVDRLPDPAPIHRKLRILDEAAVGGASEVELESLRAEIVAVVRAQVEGTDIVPLSAAAILRYNLTYGWHCGLCAHECREGGKGTPEEHIGCPQGGRFSDEEAGMAEQFVQYEDLLIPMLSALWNEKTTHDELNRIVREKEAELRRNVLEEEEALRKEALYFKEAARDRVVKIEDVHGQADEVFSRYEQELESALQLNTIDPVRRRDLMNELAGYRQSLSEISKVKARVGELEEQLTDDANQVEARRQVTLEEKVRRTSDAPLFAEVSGPAHQLLFVPRKAVGPSQGSAQDATEQLLKCRRSGSQQSSFVKVSQFRAWLKGLEDAGETSHYEVLDETSKAWVPVTVHPLFRAAGLSAAQRSPVDFADAPPVPGDELPPPLPSE